MMEFESTHDFPAGLDRLWAALGQEDYPQRKYPALGATAVRIARFSATPQAIDVELERDLPVDAPALPSWARAWVGGQQTLRQRSAWRRAGPTRAAVELHIAPVGLPVRAAGQGTIEEISPGLTRMAMTWRVESGWPVIAAAIERLFAGQVRSSLDADHAFTLRYLAAGRPRPRSRK
jgi:hypothetical protein